MSKSLTFIVLFNALLLFSCVAPKKLSSPTPPKSISTETSDWRNNTDDVSNYIKSEKEYSNKVLSPLKKRSWEIYEEIRPIAEMDLSHPIRIKDYVYFSNQTKGLASPAIYRKKDGTEANELLLDINSIALRNPGVKLGGFRISPDQNLIAFTVGESIEKMSLFIKDLKNEVMLKTIVDNVYDFEWYNSDELVFTRLNSALRANQLFSRHINSTTDFALLSEQNPDINLLLSRSKDDRYIFVTFRSNFSSRISILNIEENEKNLISILPEISGSYLVEHGTDEFIVLRCAQSSCEILSSPDGNAWETMLILDDKLITDFDISLEYVALYLKDLKTGIDDFGIMNRSTHELTHPRIPIEGLYSIKKAKGYQYDANKFELVIQSLALSPKYFEVDPSENTVIDIHDTQPVKETFKEDEYESTRLIAPSSDGIGIPVTIVYKKELFGVKANPTVIQVYGAYGRSSDISFMSEVIPLLNKGFVYAIAHVRGGGELGEKWHQGGSKLLKSNSIEDLKSVTEYLIEKGISDRNRIALTAKSAGGALVAAAVNSDPALYKVVLLDSPFVDVVSTMKNSAKKLTQQEYSEWGDPNIESDLRAMKSWSPIDNIHKAPYPNFLISIGLKDPIVDPYGTFRYIAKLRENNTGPSILVSNIEESGDHSASSGFYDYYQKVALKYAFILDRFGM